MNGFPNIRKWHQKDKNTAGNSKLPPAGLWIEKGRPSVGNLRNVSSNTMRTFLTILLLLFYFMCCAQNSNKMTEHGQKTGKWVTYFKNGKIDNIKYYEPIIRKYQKEDLFFYGLPANLDTTIYEEKLIRQEVYQYDSLWNLLYVVANNKDYYYGPNQELKFNDKVIHVIERTGLFYTWKAIIENVSNKSIVMNIKSSAKKYVLGVDNITINAKSIDTISIPVNIPNGLDSDEILFTNDTINFYSSFHTFGYDINTLDVKSGDKLTIKKSFWYYRLGEETLLKIYNKSKNKELQVIPITSDKIKIDLDSNILADFWICVYDFKNDSKYYLSASLSIE